MTNAVININFITIYTLFVTNFLFVTITIIIVTKLKKCHNNYITKIKKNVINIF